MHNQSKQLSADGYQWNQYSERVGTITNELAHFATVAYFAFNSWDEAHNFWKSIADKRQCTKAQVREAERFNTGWEVKTWGMSERVLTALIKHDRKPQLLPLPPSPNLVKSGRPFNNTTISVTDSGSNEGRPDFTNFFVTPVRRDWSMSQSHTSIHYKAA